MTMELIQHIELGSAQLGIEFTSIPQTYTDLLIVASCRSTRASGNDDGTNITFNGVSTNRSNRTLYGVGSGSGATFSESVLRGGSIPISLSTSNTFGNMSIYIPNYREAAPKSVSVDGVMENNGTYSAQLINAGLWNNNAAITSVYLFSEVANLAAGSSATLYGIKSAGTGAKATGGTIYYDAANSKYVHVFTASGTFTPTQNLTGVEYLVIAGGGGGAQSGGSSFYNAGGGGAGGYRSSVVGESSGRGSSAESTLSLTSGTSYTVTIGAGGTGGSDNTATNPTSGNNSVFGSITATGGGAGGTPPNIGVNGGSGGGSGYGSTSTTSGTTGQGFGGGAGNGSNIAGGGGGAGQAGNGNGQARGGDGIASSITGTSVYRAGGGGGGYNTTSGTPANNNNGGLGGGGKGGVSRTPYTYGTDGDFAVAGTANTGGGGGGAPGTFNYSGGGQNGANGGSGIVIVRYSA